MPESINRHPNGIGNPSTGGDRDKLPFKGVPPSTDSPPKKPEHEKRKMKVLDLNSDTDARTIESMYTFLEGKVKEWLGVHEAPQPITDLALNLKMGLTLIVHGDPWEPAPNLCAELLREHQGRVEAKGNFIWLRDPIETRIRIYYTGGNGPDVPLEKLDDFLSTLPNDLHRIEEKLKELESWVKEHYEEVDV